MSHTQWGAALDPALCTCRTHTLGCGTVLFLWVQTHVAHPLAVRRWIRPHPSSCGYEPMSHTPRGCGTGSVPILLLVATNPCRTPLGGAALDPFPPLFPWLRTHVAHPVGCGSGYVATHPLVDADPCRTPLWGAAVDPSPPSFVVPNPCRTPLWGAALDLSPHLPPLGPRPLSWPGRDIIAQPLTRPDGVRSRGGGQRPPRRDPYLLV